MIALGLVPLLIAVAWLTAAATAVRSTSRIWLRHWVERGLRGAATAELYLDRPQRLLIAAGTGNALAVFAAGMVLGAWVGGGAGLVWRVAAWSGVVLVLGQVVPRALARRWATPLVPVLLPALHALDRLVSPLVGAVRSLTRALAFGGTAATAPEHDHLTELLREGELEGVGDRDEIAIIAGVVHFGEKTVGQVMTPRDAIFSVDERLPADAQNRAIAQSGYSRVPLYRGSPDDMTGMIHVFDLFRTKPGQRAAVRPVAWTTAARPCTELLFAMLRERRHLAIVRDERGTTIGLVTLEDLLEALVGDIRDEYDEPQPPPARSPAAA
jgi:magnesium and cobalt exporter, CNNM family